MHPLPHRYQVALEADATGSTLRAPPRPEIRGGVPPEFDGTDAVWSPEHLQLAALALCYTETLRVLAPRARVTFSSLRVTAAGSIDKTPAGIAFTAFTLTVELRVAADDREAAQKLAESAKRHCIVSNSVKAPVELVLDLG